MYPTNYMNNIVPYNQQMAQRYEVIRVNGEGGARALQMLPNSSVLLLDETAPIVWLAQTDGAGYKTVTPYQITPYQPQPEINVNDLDARIRKLEEIINAKSNIADVESTN